MQIFNAFLKACHDRGCCEPQALRSQSRSLPDFRELVATISRVEIATRKTAARGSMQEWGRSKKAVHLLIFKPSNAAAAAARRPSLARVYISADGKIPPCSCREVGRNTVKLSDRTEKTAKCGHRQGKRCASQNRCEESAHRQDWDSDN